MRSRTITSLTTLALTTIVLAGCAPADQADRPDSDGSPRMVIPSRTVSPAPTGYVDSDASRELVVFAYDEGQYASTDDSGYRVNGEINDAYPTGSPVLAVRIEIVGEVPNGEADITGLSLANSHYNDSPKYALLDQKTGPTHAKDLGYPWGPKPADEPWLLEKDSATSFLTAWYVEPSRSSLIIQIDIPSVSVPLELEVPVSTPH